MKSDLNDSFVFENEDYYDEASLNNNEGLFIEQESIEDSKSRTENKEKQDELNNQNNNEEENENLESTSNFTDFKVKEKRDEGKSAQKKKLNRKLEKLNHQKTSMAKNLELLSHANNNKNNNRNNNKSISNTLKANFTSNIISGVKKTTHNRYNSNYNVGQLLSQKENKECKDDTNNISENNRNTNNNLSLELTISSLEKKIDDLLKANEITTKRLEALEFQSSQSIKNNSHNTNKTKLNLSVNTTLVDELDETCIINSKINEYINETFTVLSNNDNHQKQNSLYLCIDNILENKLRDREELVNAQMKIFEKEVAEKLRQSEITNLNNIEEVETVNKIDIQHMNNVIKTIEDNVNEILLFIEHNSVSSLGKKQDYSRKEDNGNTSNDNRNNNKFNSNISSMNLEKDYILKLCNNNSISNIENSSNSSNNSIFTILNIFSNDFIIRIEEMNKKISRTDKLIDEVLKQMNTMKRSNISFKDDMNKDYMSYNNRVIEMQSVLDDRNNDIYKKISFIEDNLSTCLLNISGLSKNVITTSNFNSSMTGIKDELKCINKEFRNIDELKINLEVLKKSCEDHSKKYDNYFIRNDSKFIVLLIFYY